jgi:uncharacterized cofD-like protein
MTSDVTAIVVVSDDGGSSGRLRREFDLIPPGDLRMALAALCPEDPEGQLWRDVVQHRFGGTGQLAGHVVGNLLIAALWEETGDVVAGLAQLGALLRISGRVLPVAIEPLEIVANVRFDDGLREVIGQVAVATTPGDVVSVRVEPANARACPEALAAIADADLLVLGPGSWFTSVLTHLLVPELRRAVVNCPGHRVVVLNLQAQTGETTNFAPETHLDVLADLAPELRIDTVVVDPRWSGDPMALRRSAGRLGADILVAEVAEPPGDQVAHHDPTRLAAVFEMLASRGRITAWQ